VCVSVIVLTARGDELKGKLRQLYAAVRISACMRTAPTAHTTGGPRMYRVSQKVFYLCSKIHDDDYIHLYFGFWSAIFGNSVRYLLFYQLNCLCCLCN